MASGSRDQRNPDRCYTLSSRPKPVPNLNHSRTPTNYGNFMYNRRVVRGSTYGQRVIPSTAHPDIVEIQRQQEVRKRAIARKQAMREQFRLMTPEALQRKMHTVVQTEVYLEELSVVIEAKEIECQTDVFLDRPPSPLFIPAKCGKDVETQIEEGELFDFDREVQPLLEVLVGKTIEQALQEVMEEEELACLRAQKRALEELRNIELAEVQRLQQLEKRRNEEKERRFAQQREVLKMERETAEKIAAQAAVQQYLAGLVPAVFSSLRSDGYFFDPVQNDIETDFMPWLMTEVSKVSEKRNAAREMLDTIILDVAGMRLEAYKTQETG